jgi:hypothetical protein
MGEKYPAIFRVKMYINLCRSLVWRNGMIYGRYILCISGKRCL